MNDQRISVDSRKIEVVLTSGVRLVGELFLQLHGIHLSGPQRIVEVLNGSETFLPIRVAGAVQLVNLDQVVAVYAESEAEFDPLLTLGEEYQVRVSTVAGEVISARIFVNLPNGHIRVKDFLNQPKKFLLFLLGDQVAYVAREKILLVED